MTPEQRARQRIDELLTHAGWVVQDYADLNLYAGTGIACREFPLTSGQADYLLYVDGRAVGVVEVKPEGFPLVRVGAQNCKNKYRQARRRTFGLAPH
jgi:type I restriction enzyme R subunit